MSKGPLPELVDHKKMAKQAALIEGLVPVARFTRLTELLVDGDGEVQLTLKFAKHKPGGTSVKGRAQTRVNLICQNCLSPYVQTLQCDLSAIIVDFDEALQDLEQIEDGIVCSEKLIGTVALVEDELILSVPMVPRHQLGVCPLDAGMPMGVTEIEATVESTTVENTTVENTTIESATVESAIIESTDQGEAQDNAEPSTYRPFAGLGGQMAGSKKHQNRRAD